MHSQNYEKCMEFKYWIRPHSKYMHLSLIIFSTGKKTFCIPNLFHLRYSKYSLKCLRYSKCTIKCLRHSKCSIKCLLCYKCSIKCLQYSKCSIKCLRHSKYNIQEEMTKKGWLLRPFELSGWSLSADDQYGNMFATTSQAWETFCLRFKFIALTDFGS